MRTRSGYARASPPILSAGTGSRGGSQASAAAGATKPGRSMAGMPSGGGPPEAISSRGTCALLRSVRSAPAWEVCPAARTAATARSVKRRTVGRLRVLGLEPRLAGALAAQGVGALEDRVIVQHGDEAEDHLALRPRHGPVSLALLRDVVAAAVGD